MTTTGKAIVIQHDAAHLPFPDKSIDLIVTSPPYFGLRDYKDGGSSLAGQIGAEASPADFLAALWACSAEWWRVLADGGSLWVNLGDKYGGSNASKPHTGGVTHGSTNRTGVRGTAAPGRPKSLLGLPWRYAIGMTDGLGDPSGTGWILRAEVVWAKTNGLPESVKDRVSRKHETWFHFVKQPKYYSNLDAIREPHKPDSIRRARPGQAGALANEDSNLIPAGRFLNPKGKAPGSVWAVATEPLKTPAEYTDHFAAFPSEFPRRIVAGWAPAGGIVLDPFGGTGTTAAVAKALGRIGITSDLSGAYCQLAQWRTSGGGYAYLAGKVTKER